MIVAELDQKRRLSRRKYVLYEDHIALEIKNPQATSRYHVHIRDLGDQLHYYAENTKQGKIILACVFLIPTLILTILYLMNQGVESGVVAALWFCCVAIGFLAYLKEPVDDIYLTNGKTNINFFRNVPSEQKVLEFIELIKKTKKEHFTKEYLDFDSDTDAQEYYERLKWLKEQDFLTKEEYEEAKIDFEIKRLL